MGSRWRFAAFVVVVALLGMPLAIGSVVGASPAPQSAAAVDGSQLPADPPPERWNRTYGKTAGTINQVAVTPNGTVYGVGSILAPDGTQLDAWVVTTTLNGTERWTRTYGGTRDDVINDVVVTADGGALVVGTSVSAGPGREDGWALKLDDQGRVEWRIATGGPEDDEFAGVQPTNDGYLIAGTYTDGENTDGWLVKVLDDGTLAWTHRYDVRVSDSFSAIERRPGGGYVLAGQTASRADPRPDGLVLTITADGTRRHQYFFGGGRSDRFLAAQATPDGGMVLVGSTRSYGGGQRGWAVRTNPDSSQRWSRPYDTGPLSAVVPTGTGRYLLAGETRPDGNLSDGVVLDVRSDGTETWTGTYGGSSYESLTSLAATPDGGYMVAGASGTNRGWPGTGWVLKLGGRPLATPLTPPTTVTPGATPGTQPTTTPGPTTGTPAAGAPPASGDEGGNKMSLLSIFIVVAVVSVFLAGFLFLLWDLADNPLEALDRRTPLVDLTVVFNHFNLGENSAAGPDPAGTGRGGNFDGRADASGGPGGFGGAGGTGGPTDESAGFGTGSDSPSETGGPADFGGAGGATTDLGDEPIDIGGGGSGAAGTADTVGAASTSTDDGAGTATATAAGAGGAGPVDESTDLVVAGGPDDESSVPATRAPVPGTFTLHNAGSGSLICRFRCHTTDDVVFDYWVELPSGAKRQAHATPTDAPFEILVNVQDDLLASQVFVNKDRGGANVTATVSEAAIDISLTEALADSPLADADHHEAPTDDEALGLAGDDPSRSARDAATPVEPAADSTDQPTDDTIAASDATESDGDWSPDVDIAEPDQPDDLSAPTDPTDETASQDMQTETADLDESSFEGDDWEPDVDIAEPDQTDEDIAEPAAETEPSVVGETDDTEPGADEPTDADSATDTDDSTAEWSELDESAGTEPWSGGIDSSQAGDIDSSQVTGPAESTTAAADSHPGDEDAIPDDDTGPESDADTADESWIEELDFGGPDDETDTGDEADAADWTDTREAAEPPADDAVDEPTDTADEATDAEPTTSADEWTTDAANFASSADEPDRSDFEDDVPDDPWMDDVDIETGESDDETAWTEGLDGIGSSFEDATDEDPDGDTLTDDDQTLDEWAADTESAAEDWDAMDDDLADQAPDVDDLTGDWAGDLRTPDDTSAGDDPDDEDRDDA